MIEYYNWILNNSDDIFNIVTAIIAAASVIAAVTPTPKDDSILSTVKAVVNVLAIHVKNAKPKE